ncbi:MAG: hypothetical protein H7096_12380 [Flavobacterium sp.]|nr:hypothetical protein [Pedobacter sp.]
MSPTLKDADCHPELVSGSLNGRTLQYKCNKLRAVTMKDADCHPELVSGSLQGRIIQ